MAHRDPTLEILTLRADDWSLWRDLRLQALQEAPAAFSSTLADWQGSGDTEPRWRDRLINVALNLVAVVDGRPGGMVSATSPDDRGRVEILSMWVAPWARGRHVGDALISTVSKWANDQHATQIILKVVVGNGPAMTLYRRNGFAENGPGDVFPDGRREQLMIRTSTDPWLDRWLPLIGEKAAGLPILELGCGSGRDTRILASAGHHVVGVDLSASAIDAAVARVPSGEFHCQDIRAPFPIESTNVVLGSLSLHYFTWSETVAVVGRIHDLLRPRGLLLCRLNSTEDHHYGASGHPTIEPNYYLVDGAPKRFFDRAAVENLFADGWNVLHLCHELVGRYGVPKALWEVGLEKAA